MEIIENPLIKCNFIRNLCKRIQEINSEVLEHENSVPKCEICSENTNEFASIKNQLFIILKINLQIKDEEHEGTANQGNTLKTRQNELESEVIKTETETIEEPCEISTNFVAVEDYLDNSNDNSSESSQLPKHVEGKKFLHSKKMSEGNEGKDLKKFSSKLYECALCQTKVSKKCHLVLHMRKHSRKEEIHGNRSQATPKSRRGPGTSKTEQSTIRKCPFCNRLYKRRHECNLVEPKVVNVFSCEFCPETFSTYPKIYFHHKAHHPDKSKPLSPFQCDVCGKFTVQLSALRHHMKTHTGYTPYVCDVCQKRFRTRHQLTEHLRKHIPKSERDDKYKCDICQKKFTFRQSLKKHERLQHTESRKVFPCTLCGWKFICETSLQKHLTTHDGEAAPAYKCGDCDRIFEKLKYLNQHRKIQHNILTDLMVNRKSRKKK